MSCLPRNSVLINILFLFLRTFISIAEGQGSPPEWNSRGELDPLYRQQIPASEKPSLINPFNTGEEKIHWPQEPETLTRGLNEVIFSHPLRNRGFNQFYDTYLQTKGQKHPERSNALDAYTSNQAVQQQAGSSSLGVSMDYPFDEFAQQPGYSSTFSEEYIPATRSRIKPRQAKISRYLVFSNLKRNRDGYMCHFKLCQVGVSGKRLSM
ncbi:unnamed protein product [Orchesella dallaii]|uniref:Uncharacterized protein n=1 Tax=Orchesella dallaii TaxID=48710 RepID=A0ABP1QRA3_9HEXA